MRLMEKVLGRQIVGRSLYRRRSSEILIWTESELPDSFPERVDRQRLRTPAPLNLYLSWAAGKAPAPQSRRDSQLG